MIRDYESGALLAELAERYGGTDVTARNMLKRHGVRLRRKGPVSAWTGSAEQLADAIRRYGQRESLSSIAKSIGCDTPFVANALKSAGVTIRKNGSKQDQFSSADAQRIASRHAAGEPISSLARELKVSSKMTGALIVRGGGQVRGREDLWTQERHDEIRDRFLAGERVGDLAKAYGCHQSGISKSLNKSGVLRPKSGPGHFAWKGGRTITGDGYVSVLVLEADEPFCAPHTSGRVLEHRLVMGRALGRPLTDYETVHHVDGDHANNALDNLQLRFGKHGKGVALQCRDCGSHNVEPIPLAE